MNGVCGVTDRPRWIGLAEAPKVHDFVVVHNAERQAGDVHRPHLFLEIGVDGGEVGSSGLRTRAGVLSVATRHAATRSDRQCSEMRHGCGFRRPTRK